jgi:exodeoxyribonuclease VII small subunit
MAKKKSYEELVEELEEILSEIESEEVSVDELSSKVKRATEIIKHCKKVLSDTETDIEEILKDLSTEE